ncbi:MAG: hypothetical protein ACO1NO_09855 [Burkholderiaceae bacterium]
MPRLAIAMVLLLLVMLASALSYTGYLVVGVVAEQLGTGRLMAGFLLGVLFARIPWITEQKLRTVGLLPRRARLPVMVALIAFCLLSYLYRGELVPVLFLAFAGLFLLGYPWLRTIVVGRAMSSLFTSPVGRGPPKRADDGVIDVEFREKKD